METNEAKKTILYLYLKNFKKKRSKKKKVVIGHLFSEISNTHKNVSNKKKIMSMYKN